MKITYLLLFIILFTSAGYTCQKSSDNKGINSNFNYNNSSYKSILPFSKLEASKNFNIEEANFEVQIKDIILIAKEHAKKIDSIAKWSVESVGLYKYNYSSCNYWYYQVNLSANNPGNNYLYLNLGLNGEKPDIYKINEVLISN